MNVILDKKVHRVFTIGTPFTAEGEKYKITLQTTNDPAYPNGLVVYITNFDGSPYKNVAVANINKAGSHDCQIKTKGPKDQISYDCKDTQRICIQGVELASDPTVSMMLSNRHDPDGGTSDYLLYSDSTSANLTFQLDGKIPPNVG